MAQQVQQALEAVADGTGTCEAVWAVPVGRPWRLTRMAATGNTLVLPPSPEENSQRYRGVWNGDGPLIYSQDFSAGPTLPAGFAYNGSAGNSGRINMGAVPSRADDTKPAYTYAWLLDGNYKGFYVTGSQLAGTSGKIITRVAAWMASRYDYSFNHNYQTRAAVKIGGTNSWLGSPSRFPDLPGITKWQEASVRPSGADVWNFRGINQNSFLINPLEPEVEYVSHEAWITGLRVWGKAAEDQYVLNDTVAHEGYLYVCTLDNTAATPGTDSTWERIEGTQSSTGYPHLLVYRNGSLIDSSGNANSDLSECSIDLNAGDVIRAVWSRCSGGARMRLVLDGDG